MSGDSSLEYSDIDLIAVFGTALDRGAIEDVTSALRHPTLPCPAHGLDLVAYGLAEVQEPSPGLRYEFSVSSGREWDDEVSFGGPYPGGLIDLAAAREFGRSLDSAAPDSVMGPVRPEWIRVELARALRWHRGRIHDEFHDPLGTNALLNACRALHFLRSGSLVSKSRGAEPFLGGPDRPIVAQALRARRSPDPQRLPRDQVMGFVERALHEFERHGG